MALIMADVGGTNVRFALSSRTNSQLTQIKHLRCADFDNFECAYEKYVTSISDKQDDEIHLLSLAVAGPVNSEFVKVSNSHWKFEKSQLIDRLKLNSLLVINDFTAQALAQEELISEYNVQLLKGISDPTAPLLVIGPGTGLGVSALILLRDGPLPIEGEGGNVCFSPQTDVERNLDAYLREHKDHIVVENFVSGPGLEAIYGFMSGKKITELNLSADKIGLSALRENGLCRDAVNTMFGILGSVMADHVLTIGCWRGAVIAGGIMPRLAPLIMSSSFPERFRSAGQMRHLLENVPVWLSKDPNAGLKGARAALDNPHLAHRIKIA